jgi:predicted Zn-dependent peptidase
MPPVAGLCTHTYPNGLTLLVESMPDVRSAAFSLLVPAGSAFDAPASRGAAAVLTDWMLRGAGPLDSRELTTALDNLGLSRSEGAATVHISFSGATLAEKLPEALALYADMLQRPHLPEDEFEPSRVGVEQSLRGLEDEPRQKVMQELKARCYPTPWGLPNEGSLDSITTLTADAVRAHAARCVRPNGAILAIAGYVDAQELIDLVGRLFGDWQTKPDPVIESGPPGPQIDHLPHESTQTQIGVAYHSVPYNHPEYYAAWAAVNVLSGGMSARLFTEVREKRGLCYSVYATTNTLKDQARVLCYAGTTTERAQETLDVLIGELVRLKDGIAQDELARCQARAKSSLIMQQESSTSRASSIARDWYHLGRVTTLAEIRAEIDRLTVPLILEHVHRHPAQDFVVVTMGTSPLEVRRGVL